MKLGYSLAGTGLGPDALGVLATEAERLGYASVWSSEVMGTDPIAVLGLLAGRTSAIGLGTAVLQISGRAAVTTAAGAATLSRLSAGRLRLGLGTSGPQVAEGWHGQPGGRPLTRMRDYVAVLRLALAGEPVSYDGETLTLPRPGSEATPRPLLAASARAPHVPVYLAGLGPKAITLAGEIGDGLLAIHCPPEYIARAGAWLRAGAQRGGRRLDDFDLAVMVLVHVDEDLDFARDMVRAPLAVYLGGMGTQTTNFYNRLAVRLGYEAEAARVQEAFLAGDIDEAITALSDDLVDAMTICGPAARVRSRLSAYRAAGTTTLIAGSAVPSRLMRSEQMERLAALAHAGASS